MNDRFAFHQPVSFSRRRGFSLVELAIVVSVIGIILASIWGYAAQTNDITEQQQAVEDISTIVQNVRAAYAGQLAIGGGYGGVSPTIGLTQQLINMNAIPSNIVRTNGCAGGTAAGGYTSGLCADSPWGANGGGNGAAGSLTTIADNGSLGVCTWPVAAINTATAETCALATAYTTAPGNPLFGIEFHGLKAADCIALATQVSTRGQPGLVDVFINAKSMVNAGGTLSVSPASAEANCATPAAVGGAAMATLSFVYRLKASNF